MSYKFGLTDEQMPAVSFVFSTQRHILDVDQRDAN